MPYSSPVPRRSLGLAALWLALVAFSSGCDCAGPVPTGRSCRSSADCRATEDCVDSTCRVRMTTDVRPDLDAGPGIDAPPRTLVSISVEPGAATLTSVDGSMPTQTFTVLQHFSDGTSAPALGPVFALGDRRLGSLDVASGAFASNGAVGGETTVTATLGAPGGGTLTADATLTVTLERTLRGTGIDDAAVALFSTPAIGDATRAATIVYPLEGAVMPQNVFPADVQWLNGASGDYFRVTLEKAHARIVAYVAYDGDNHYRADDDATRDDPSDGTTAWRGLTQTDPGTAASIRVDRYEAATAMVYGGSAVSVTFAEAALVGSVYYWDIARGRIVRIDDGTATRVEFMPSPPLDLTGSHCVGCHSVSPSGRWMAGRLGGGDNIGGIFDLTTDLTGDPPPVRWPLSYSPPSATWWFSSWSPDETRMIVSYQEAPGSMRLIDPRDGTFPPVTGTLPTLATHPVWSPDGTRIAYVTNHAPGWGGDFSNGDIAILPVVGPDSFGLPTIVHTGASLAGAFPSGNADSYPTWSPDSSLLAFAHGDNCRSEIPPPPMTRAPAHAALYAMLPDGTSVVRLDRASGGASGDDSFQPRFSPFEQAGYYWMSFLSRRDYGNAMVGTRGAGRQQIWVAAIRVSGTPGEDPSAVAYWLPGQNTESMNIAAYWAPRACRPDGEGCTVGSECCGGECDVGPGGAFVCAPPPPDRCRDEGETCTTDADCCMGMDLTCIANVCIAGPG